MQYAILQYSIIFFVCLNNYLYICKRDKCLENNGYFYGQQ